MQGADESAGSPFPFLIQERLWKVGLVRRHEQMR